MDAMVKQIEVFLEKMQMNPVDVCANFMKSFFSKSNEPGKLLQVFIEKWEDVGKDDVPVVLLNGVEEDAIKKKYKPLVLEIVRVIYDETDKQDVFYKKLYESVFKSGIFPKDEKIEAVLLKMMVKEIPMLPYYPVDHLLVMSNEEFLKASQSIRSQLRKADGIIYRGFGSRTELVSQLYRIASEIESEELKIVYWSLLYYYASGGNK
jgi:hypothetical protein